MASQTSVKWCCLDLYRLDSPSPVSQLRSQYSYKALLSFSILLYLLDALLLLVDLLVVTGVADFEASFSVSL